jgi:hypothetical protein
MLSLLLSLPVAALFTFGIGLALSCTIAAVRTIVISTLSSQQTLYTLLWLTTSGLMDFGSAAFVYVSGLLPPARVPQSTFRTLLASWPLAVLAGARLIAVKLFQYPEHTSEYGVHWNFFGTLLCLRVVVLLIRQLRRQMHVASSSVAAAVVTAVSLLVGYQYALQHGLQEYILTAPRGTSLLADNRYTNHSMY